MAMVTAQLGLREKGRIRGVVVSSNGPTLVAVDADGQPLDFAMTWMDRRAEEEADLIAEFSDTPLDASFYLPKAFWIMRHKPEIYERTRHFLPCAEYVSFFLTGNAVRIVPTPLFKDFFWNEGAIPRLHMDQDKFPPFVDVGDLLGTVCAEAEETLGIPAGLPVFAGGPDFIMSILGTASIVPGRACDRAGTSEGINLCWSAPVHDKRLLCFPHVVRGTCNVSAMISSSGSAMDWAVRTLGNRQADIEELIREAETAVPGAGRLLFLPFLTPERFPIWDADLRGAFLGLTLDHGRPEMMRAVVESTGFAVRSVIAAMEADGCQLMDLRVTGGLARLPFWCQARADITGQESAAARAGRLRPGGQRLRRVLRPGRVRKPDGSGGEPRSVPEDIPSESRHAAGLRRAVRRVRAPLRPAGRCVQEPGRARLNGEAASAARCALEEHLYFKGDRERRGHAAELRALGAVRPAHRQVHL